MIQVNIGNKIIGKVDKPTASVSQDIIDSITRIANTKEWKDYIGKISKNGRGRGKKAELKP